MTRTFQPDDRIAHYRVVGPLGTGGMGEVHIAKDEKLERSVALKVLPPDLVRNEERVRRFVTEAKSASALNHPNIVTIYEIGHDRVRPGDGSETEGDPIHYIAMELVSGETLDQKIHRDRTDLRTLMGYLAQAAEGVAKAHAAGVVHRDLKPGNIMVSKDGFTKVLDFGLAKLVEREASSGDDLTSAPTAGAATRAGMLMGTVGYMSPEQVQAKAVDHRSDIFSMGIILYEAATHRRPFVADTDVEVMHQILRDKPPALEELNPEVPSALRRLIRRCLAKSPDQRLQSMKDLAIELREIVEEWDSLNVTSSSSRSLSSAALGAPPERRGLSTGLVIGAVVVGLAGLGFGLHSFLGGEKAPPVAEAPAPQLQMTPIMSRNDLREATLSADGRYLAYVTSSGRHTDLNVRQVRTGSDVTIVADSEVPIRGVSFSPDGDYLYFLNRDPELPNYSALFEVASLGGTPRKVLFDVDSAVAFSPDGSRVCFRRGLLDQNADSVVVAELASGEDRELARVAYPTQFRGLPAWSPDGRAIAVGLQSVSRGVKAWVEVIDAETGERRRLSETSWLDTRGVGWLGEGSALVVNAFDPAAGTEPQLYRLSLSDGKVDRITSDLDGYTNVSVSGDGESIAAVRRSTVSNMWVARVEVEDDATPLTFASGSAASMGQIAPLPGDATAFTAPRDNHFFLWRMEADGSERRQLTTEGIWVFDARWTEASGIVFSMVQENPEIESHIWRIAADGTRLEQLTSDTGEQMEDLSPDGSALLYRRWEGPGELWGLRLDGSEPFLVAENVNESAIFSPDGERVLLTRIEDQGDQRFFPVRFLVPFDGGEPLARFLLPPGAQDIEWAPDGASLTFVDRGQGWNLMRKRLPDGPVEPITTFTEGQVLGHEWSPDGSRIALHRRLDQKESLWQLLPGETSPTRIVEYKTGNLSRYRWAPDAPLLYYAYSTSTQDVVMMSGVR